ncbi:MAG: RidA family protein [Planctomycetota bacterium]
MTLGLALSPVGKPAGAYKPCLIIERMVYVSGHLPLMAGRSLVKGKVGLTILPTLVANLGSLDRFGRVVKLMGLVNCPTDFVQHPHVINGCSELFAEVWGADHGVGVRSAFGAGSLPLGVAVEIEAVFELA